MTDAEQQRVIRNYAIALNEHFDCVLILASFTKQGATDMLVGGDGNYYAKRGMAMEWLAREDEKSRIDVRPNFEDDDDSEHWKCGAGI